MKKIITLLLIVLFCYGISNGQSKQVKMYQQQIGLNKVLINYLDKAMAIAKFGLTSIGDIKNGEFNLHHIFFNKLKSVNSNIKNLTKVTDIVVLQVQIIKNHQSSYRQIKASNQFTKTEIKYILSVFSKLLDDTGNNLDELFNILSANQYQMTDDERIKRIDDLHTEMQGSFVFTQHFSKELLILAIQRLKEKNEVSISRRLYDLK